MQRRPQLPHPGVQPLLLLPQRVQLFLLPVQPVAQLRRLPQNINLRRPLLLAQARNLPLQLLEQILQPDPPLPLHVVVQVALLQRFLLLGGLGRGSDRRRRRRHGHLRRRLFASARNRPAALLLVAAVAATSVPVLAVVLAGALARVHRQRGVRAGNARRAGRRQIVGREAVLARTLEAGAGHATAELLLVAGLVVRVAPPVLVVRGHAGGLLADLVRDPALEGAAVAGRRVGRQVLLADRDHVDFFLCWGRRERGKWLIS